MSEREKTSSIAVQDAATRRVISDAPTDELKSRLTTLLARSASDLQEMAEIVTTLESRGEDLHGLRIGLIGYLRRIARGQLLPEVVVRFSGRPGLIDSIARLGIAEQKRLAEGGTVSVAVWKGDTVDNRQFDPLSLTDLQRKQVFGDGEIRSIEQQVPLLTNAQTLERASRAKRQVGRIRVDKATGEIIVNRTPIAYGELLAALSELSGPTPDDEPTIPVTAKLTAEQHRRLKVHCAKYECTIAEAITLALAATGVFRNPS